MGVDCEKSYLPDHMRCDCLAVDVGGGTTIPRSHIEDCHPTICDERASCMRLIAVALIAWAALSSGCAAQAYPTRPIRVIVATSPGGISDIFIRAIGDDLHKAMGQPLVIENRAGGGFNIAARACASADGDGYTICVLPAEAVTYNIFLMKNLGFDPVSDLAPITNLFFITQALALSSSLKVKTLTELASLSKARSGTLSYSAAGYSQTLFVESFKKQSGADIVRLPFKGGGDAVTGLITGSTPVTFVGVGNLIAHINSGAVVPVLVDSATRSPLAPDAPTIAEHGYKGDITRSYFGLFAPAKISPTVSQKVREEISLVVGRPEFVEKQFTQRGLVPAISDSTEEFAAFLRIDRDLTARVVKESGLQPQ